MNFEEDKQKDKRLSQLLSTAEKSTVKPDKEFLNKLQEKTAAEFMASSANKTKQSIITIPLWRIIMKNQVTQFVAAAVIIAVVLFTFFYPGTKSVYALDQTIEAMRKITSVHCFVKDINEEKTELWIGVNPETGANEKIYADNSKETRITTPIESYVYDKKNNIVRHSQGSLDRSDIRFGRFIEDFFGIAKAMNADIKKTEEINGNKKIILLVLETNQFTLKCRINPVTKLPISMQMIPKSELQPGQLGLSIEDFTFNAPLPEGIFDFVVPEGAQVIEQ